MLGLVNRRWSGVATVAPTQLQRYLGGLESLGGMLMWNSSYSSAVIVASVLAIGTALAPVSANAQAPRPQAPAPAPTPAPVPPPPVAKPGPYKLVPIKPPPAVGDATFEAFRKQLAEIAQKKDRAALAKLVAATFFWVPETGDVADKTKPAIDNLAKAIVLDGKDAVGWEAIAEYAGETTANPDPQRAGVICAPGEPGFDDKAADELANATHTDPADWLYPTHDGVEVRSAPQQTADVVEKLGLHFVRALEDDSPANAVTAQFLKIMTPSGKTGYVPVETLRAIVGPQMCYLKDAGGWKIAGFLGGDPAHAN
jgi:hypothetical protein